MKKTLIAAIIIATGISGYWYNQQTTQMSNGNNSVLSYVPADTPILFAQLKPFPIKSYINSLSEGYRQYPDNTLDELEQESEPRARFLLSIAKSYMASMKDGSTFINTFGLAENIRSYFYTLGLMPVIKVEVENADAIWALLDKAETDSGITHTNINLKGVDVRSYPLTSEIEKEHVNLIVAVHNGLLTATITTSLLSDDVLLETALGITPIEKSVIDAHIIDDIIKNNDFMNESIGYINHQVIATGLTSIDGNLLAVQLSQLFKKREEDPLIELRTPKCKQEFTSIANNWPRTVAGYDEFKVTNKESTFNLRTVVESNNLVLLDAYQAMRGYIPSYVQDVNNVFSFGLGIDINQMAPSLSTIWEDMLTPEYQCGPLAQIQGKMSQNSPAMLGMFTGMANGVKGFGVSLIDYKINEDLDNPQLESLDAVVSLSAENPNVLFNLAKTLAPELADIQLPTNGNAIELNTIIPMPEEIKISPKLAIKGEHIVLFAGEKGEAVANALGEEPLVSNGLMVISTDYRKIFKPLLSLWYLTGESIPEDFNRMKDYNMSPLNIDSSWILIR